MEKLKPYLLMIQQHHFWLLLLVAIVALFYAWSTGTTEIESSFKKNKGSIDRQFMDLKSKSKSRGGEHFPNENWIEKRKKLTDELTVNGKRALKNIHDVQRDSQTWPETLHPDSKMEIAEDRWTEDTVADYLDAAKEEVDRFRTILGTADGPDEAGIFWDAVDFNDLKQSVNDKEIRAEKDCKMFQQILWVYEALVVAIQKTNKAAEDPFDLPIYSIKNTAVFQEASENIDELAWKINEDKPVLNTKKDVKKPSARTRGKKSAKENTPANFQPQMRTIIAKPATLEGYDVIAFRIQVRMQISFLESFLRSIANMPIPMILEGIRFQHTPDLKVVKTVKPEVGRRTFRRSRGSKQSIEEKKDVDQVPDESIERGTLVEIWGFAYLANVDSDAPEENQSARLKHSKMTASK